MAHNITELDMGFVTGGRTWHGLPQYKVCEAIGMLDARKCVDYAVRKLPAHTIEGRAIPGGFYAARTDTTPPTVLAPNLGDRYEIIDRRRILDTFDEFLLAEFPQLKVAGVGTLSAGRTFWIQFVAEKYHVRGDHSDHELRLCYSETYGWTAHEVYCSHVRIVCDNTRRMARSEAIAAGMFEKCRHTKSAACKINATAEAFAELHMELQKDVEAMEYLAGEQCDGETLDAFLDEFIPLPKEKEGKRMGRALNAAQNGRKAVVRNFESGRDTMESGTATSLYGLLQAYTDYADHDSYSRSPYDRWMDAQAGQRAERKQKATDWLLQRA